MSLIEALIAGLLFTISAGSSLQIWSQLCLGVLQEERHQQLADRLEAELAALDASLRLRSRQTLQQPPCGNSATTLQTLLGSRPSAEGVERRLTPLPADDGVLLELTIEGLPLRRQRLYLPAALGLCSPAAPTPTPVPVPVPTVQIGGEPLASEPAPQAPQSEPALQAPQSDG